MRVPSVVKIGGAILLLSLFLLLLGGALWGGIQSNRAFVSLNHQPTILTTELDDAYLADIEAQLKDAAQQSPNQNETHHMLAVIQQAHGDTPADPPSTKDLIAWGQRKEEGGDLEAAEFLYQWATEQQPQLGDGWYYLGRVYTAQNRIAEADSAYQRSTVSLAWNLLGPSDSYLALGNLYAQSDPDSSRNFYELALNIDQFGETAAKAQAHYQLGELLLLRESNPTAAIPHYQATLTFAPDDHWARLRLGYTLYWGNDQFSEAEHEIQSAINIWPDEKYLQWPYFYLGEIYQDAGMTAEAITAYETVLELDPTETRVRERLESLRDQ